MKECIEPFAAASANGPVVFSLGQPAHDDDPYVAKYPQFFRDAEAVVHTTGPGRRGKVVEEATTEPGHGRHKLSRPLSKGRLADDPDADVPADLKRAPAEHQAAYVAKVEAGGKPESKGVVADSPDAPVPAGLDEAPAADQAAFVDEDAEQQGAEGPKDETKAGTATEVPDEPRTDADGAPEVDTSPKPANKQASSSAASKTEPTKPARAPRKTASPRKG